MNEQQLQASLSRRFKSEDRYLARLEKREAEAERFIGELNSGKYYIWPQGGKYREANEKYDLIAFLIRNRYV